MGAGRAPRERAPVLAELGGAEALAGEPGGVEHLRQAVRLASDPLLAARASLSLARTLKFEGHAVEACEVLETALDREPAHEKLKDTLETELLSLAYVSSGARQRLLPRLAGLREPEGSARGQRDLMVLASLAYNAVAACEPAERAVSLIHRMLAASRGARGGHS